jgi:hypothetical protein
MDFNALNIKKIELSPMQEILAYTILFSIKPAGCKARFA